MIPTPTINDSLAYRPGGFATLAEGLDYAARGETGFNFFSAKGDLQAVLTYRELRERAIRLRAGPDRGRLQARGRVLLIADTDPDFMVMFFGCQYAGLLPVPVVAADDAGRPRGLCRAAAPSDEGSGAVAAMAPDELIGFLSEAAEGLGLPSGRRAKEFYDLPRATPICARSARTSTAICNTPRAAPASPRASTFRSAR